MKKKQPKYDSYYCTIEFREKTINLYPGDLDTPAKRALYLRLVLRPTWIDRDTNMTIAPIDTLRVVTGDQSLVLADLEALGYITEIIPGDYGEGLASTFAVEANPYVQEEIECDRSTAKMVDWITGKPVTTRMRNKRKAVQKAKVKMELEEIDIATHPAAIIFESMADPRINKWHARQAVINHNKTTFTIAEVPDAVIYDGDTGQPEWDYNTWEPLMDSSARTTSQLIFNSLYDGNPQIYGPAHNTDRVIGRGLHTIGMVRRAREEFYSGPNVMSGDIKSCQTKMGGVLWGIEMLQDPEIVNDWWCYLASQIYETLTPALKDFLKLLTYLVMFGGEKKLAIARTQNPALVKEVWALPVFQEMLIGRAREQARIKSDGGILDAFGKPHELSAPSLAHKNLEAQVRSLACRHIQSHEVACIKPAYEQFRLDRDLMPLWHGHDGIYYLVTDHIEQTDRKNAGVKYGVEAKGKEFGFDLTFEIKPLLSTPSAAYIAHLNKQEARTAKRIISVA